MKTFVLLLAVACLSACVPWPTTDRPGITFIVKDRSGAPIEGATVKLATYSTGMAPKDGIEELLTDSAGRAQVSNEWHWQVVVLAADGASFNSWSWCVEKPGYDSAIKNDLKANGVSAQETVVLIASAASAACTWVKFPYKFERVGPNRAFNPTATSPLRYGAAAG